MGLSKEQRDRPQRKCACGCGQSFRPFPVYRPKSEGGGLRYPKFIRGHHPVGRKKLSTGRGWNRGMKKGDHPSLERMGFQVGHAPYNDWCHVNELLRNDPKTRARWLTSKKGQRAWNTGLTRDQYPNGIASGDKHGNWAGGHGGIRDTAEWQRLRREIWKRDRYTCQLCGDRNRKGRGRRIVLHADHIKPVAVAPDLALDPENLRTLCGPCHRLTDTYGSKAVRMKKRT